MVDKVDHKSQYAKRHSKCEMPLVGKPGLHNDALTWENLRILRGRLQASSYALGRQVGCIQITYYNSIRGCCRCGGAGRTELQNWVQDWFRLFRKIDVDKSGSIELDELMYAVRHKLHIAGTSPCCRKRVLCSVIWYTRTILRSGARVLVCRSVLV